MSRHRNGKWPQCVQNLHRSSVLRDNFRETAIGHRALVEIGAD
jgi:hypothetical protein